MSLQPSAVLKRATFPGPRDISFNIVLWGLFIIIKPEQANPIPLSQKGVPPAKVQAKLDTYPGILVNLP